MIEIRTQAVKESVKLGIFFALAQLLFCLGISTWNSNLSEAYSHLNQWDSFHYLEILKNGYHLPTTSISAADIHSGQANLSFFPGYPLLARAISRVFNLSGEMSLLVTAQAFCFLFWFELGLLLRGLGVNAKTSTRAAIAIAIYPASFFMVAGYSESLFSCSLIGFLLWSELLFENLKKGQDYSRSDDGLPEQGLARMHKQEGQQPHFIFQKLQVPSCLILTIIHGYFIGFTRLVGLPLFLYPLIRYSFFHKSLKTEKTPLAAALTISFFVLLGGISFFLWCHFEFQEWNVYFRLQKMGWGNVPNYLAILDPRSYLPKLFFENTPVSVYKASNFFILILFGITLKSESSIFAKDRSWRWGIYFCAFSLFYVSLSGKANAEMDSMVRYNFPVFILLVITLVDLQRTGQLKLSRKLQTIYENWGWLGYLTAFIFQYWMILLFTRGRWVS